ncbi:velvet factor, partial [Hysterangium stoloniferum]
DIVTFERTYYLHVVQHPHKAAEFGINDMARIPLAPPLFVQLAVRNKSGVFIPADEELPFLVAAITLHDAANPNAEDLSSNSELYGTTIAAPQNLRDPEGTRGVYFIFPDVGVRRRGQWRLHVSLMRIALVGSPTVLTNGDAGTRLTGAWTNPFDIVPAQGYIAPSITPLTRHFQSQGIRMFISNSVVRDRP